MDKEIKQSRAVGKSSGAKDARSLARNPNRTVQPPDMPDMGTRVSLDGPDPETLEVCVGRRRAGRTFPQIAEDLGVPVEDLYRWNEDPNFFEEMQTGFSSHVEELAEETLQLGDQLPKIKGLRPADKVMAGKIQISTRLRVAEARLPGWNRQGEAGGGVMLQVTLSGPIKTMGLPGSPDGQNAAALYAMRKEDRERCLASLSPEARAAALKVLADLVNKRMALPAPKKE